jgi:hypothetical protein
MKNHTTDESIGALRAAITEKNEIHRLNAPVRRLNREIKKRNQPFKDKNDDIDAENKRLKSRGFKNDLLPLFKLEKLMKSEHRISPESMRVFDSEKTVKVKLNSRTRSAWLRKIESIDDLVVRTRAACIIWWDYFSNSKSYGKPSELEWFLGEGYQGIMDEEVGDNLLADTLIKCDYTPSMAINRVCVIEEKVEI